MAKLPDNIDSKFRFITIAAMRAKQLQRGALPKIDSDAKKPTAIAREEVMSGAIEFQCGEDAIGAMDESDIEEVLGG